MATNAQRAQAIGDALLNKAATPAQLNRLGLALAALEGREAEYAKMTNGEKAGLIVSKIRRYVVAAVKQHDETQASATARANAAAAVDSEFSEA